MLRKLFCAVVTASVLATAAYAEPPVVKPMPDPEMGDHWTYTWRDEITGQDKGTFTRTVTEVRGEEIGLRITAPGASTLVLICDRQWNVKSNPGWRYAPSDGFGVKSPLAVGQTWKVDSRLTNRKGDTTWNNSITARVVGQSSLTTKAGQFDAFEIEFRYQKKSDNSPGIVQEGVLRIWYAPAIDHWVKRYFEERSNGYLVTKSATELVEYGRRESN